MSLIKRPTCREQAALVVLFGLILAASNQLFADDTMRDPIKGQVDEGTAVVQTIDNKEAGDHCQIEAKIKFVKAGTYVVAGGYNKGEIFQASSSSGKKYFATKTVKVDAGDVITVKLRVLTPPVNRKITAAVFKSDKDIPTTKG
jgi:hypothetical protein